MATNLLLVSDGSLMAPERVLETLHDAGLAAAHTDDPERVPGLLRGVPVPLVVDTRTVGVEALLGRLRGTRELYQLPVVALVREATDASMAEALAWGADTVVPGDNLEELGPTARALCAQELDAQPRTTRGSVVVAFADPDERRMRARPLRSVGFEVLFAADPDELVGALALSEVCAVLSDAGLFRATPARDVLALQAADPSRRPWVLTTATPEVPGLLRELLSARASVVGRNAPPEDALFLLNDLLRTHDTDGRESPRLLHATVARFRAAGGQRVRHGVTYNVSKEGVFVRTVLPPARGSLVWLELRPHGDDAMVHLECQVVWTRPFGASLGASAPAGFGVHVEGVTPRDRERWLAGYRRVGQNLVTQFPAMME